MVRKKLGKRVAEPKTGDARRKKVKKAKVVDAISSALGQAAKVIAFSSAPIDAKLSKLFSLFATYLQENGNVRIPKTDIWSMLPSILPQSQGHDADLWPLMTITLKVCPRAFEPVLDQILALALAPNEADEGKVVETFLTELVSAFDKLQKIPKFLEMLLVALRQNGETRVPPLLAKIASLVGPLIGGLVAGQIKYLWRKLEWNAEVEALSLLKADVDDKSSIAFFSSVVALYVEFLSNIPPEPTFAEMMTSLREQFLRPLGALVEARKPKKLDPDLIKSFLRLGLAYGELQGRFLLYCDEFRHVGDELKSNFEGSDLSLLHPYFESGTFIKGLLEKKNCDEEIGQLLINLLVQKLTFTAALSPNSAVSVTSTATAELIWSMLQSKPKLFLSDFKMELIKRHLDPDEILSLASSLVHDNDDGESLSSSLKASSSSPRLHFALIFQILKEVLQRLSKDDHRKRGSFKKVAKSLDTVDVSSFLSKNSCPASSCPLTELLVPFVNSLMNYSPNLSSLSPISGLLSSLAGLELVDYQENVKNVIFLTSIACAMMSTEAGESLSILLEASISPSQGNSDSPLFGLKWKQLFFWCWTHLKVFGEEFRPKILRVMLEVVAKREAIVEEAEEGRLFKGASQLKLGPKIVYHACVVSSAIVSSLPTTAQTSNSPNFFKNVLSAQTSFRLKLMDEGTTEEYKQKLPALIKIGFEALKSSGKMEEERSLSLRTNAIKFLVALFSSRQEFKEGNILGDEIAFLEKLWIYLESFESFGGLRSELFGKMEPEELSFIGARIVDRIRGSMFYNPLKHDEVFSLLSILSELAEAELGNSAAKDARRRHILGESMKALSVLPLKWGWAMEDSLQTLAVPFITIHTKLIQKRGALLNLQRAVAASLSLVLSCPLRQYNTTSSFRHLFVALTAMLKAVAIHGLGVLEDDSNDDIFFKAFRCIISALGSKADQEQGQSDEGRSDFATCARSIERLCKSMKEGAGAFRRLTPKLVAILIRQLEGRALDPTIKDPLIRGCYELLELCDTRDAEMALYCLLTDEEVELLDNIKSTKQEANFN